MKEKQFYPVCGECGSDQVTVEGQLAWSKKDQDWALCETYSEEESICGDCHNMGPVVWKEIR